MIGGRDREQWRHLRPSKGGVQLESGMCFHFRSGMWPDDSGAAIPESFVVTESGGVMLPAD